MATVSIGRSGLRAAGALAVAAACSILASPASAQDVCLSKTAQDAVDACGETVAHGSTHRASRPLRMIAPSREKTAEAGVAPKPPPISAAIKQRDLRRKRHEKTATRLLVQELQGLERLYETTSARASDRPGLMRRIAEGYAELERVAVRDATERRAAQSKSKTKQPQQAKKHAEAAKKAEEIAVAARSRAIKYYAALKKGYPTWCERPNAADPQSSTGCGDEILYYLAYEYEQANKLEPARKAYLELIQRWPASRYVPQAYLAFGELFFQQAQSDPSAWPLAEKSYLEVTQHPPPDNKVFGYAHYKLGYVYWNQGDHARALASFKKTIEYGQQFATDPNATSLAAAARRDLIPVYAQSGDPKAAYTFFKPLSGAGGGDDAMARRMKFELGTAYLDTGHYGDAISLFEDLKGRDEGPRRCELQGKITEATFALRSGDKPSIDKALRAQLAEEARHAAGDFDETSTLKCKNVTAAHLVDTAMAWHIEAVGTGGVRGTNDARTMELAANLYGLALARFPAEEFARFSFPRIVKEDWPTRFRLRYLLGDLEFTRGAWESCGKAFDAAIDEDPKAPDASEAAYAAALCYQRHFLAQKVETTIPDGTRDLSAKPLTKEQEVMLRSFDRYLCRFAPAKGDGAAEERFVDIKMARAQTYFQAQRWEEAAAALRDVAFHHAGAEAGSYASDLYLEVLNLLGTRATPARTACIDAMATDVPALRGLYCNTPAALDEHGEHCDRLATIQHDVEVMAIGNDLRSIDEAGGNDAPERYKEAGDRYMALWQKLGAKACDAGPSEACKRNDKVLYNAARAYQAAHLVMKAIGVRKVLVDPRHHLHETPLAQKALYEIGGSYQAIAVYDEAARWYERLARDFPGFADSPTALADATVLRMGLGEPDAALENAATFRKHYATKKPAEASRIAFAVAEHHAERRDWEAARSQLLLALGAIDRGAELDVRIQAHALLGRVEQALGQDGRAAAEYDRVTSLTGSPDTLVDALGALGGTDDQKQRRLARVLTAVGEARFFTAEEERRRAEAIEFPAYRGAGRRDDVLRHINTEVKAWVEKKRAAIERAERAYLAVLQVEPSAPPRWVIASGTRVGQLWSRFTAEFRATPIPIEWRGEGLVPGTDITRAELRALYWENVDRASEPQRQRAKAAYQTCLGYAVRFQHFDDNANECEAWLSKNYPAEYSALDELRSTPNRIAWAPAPARPAQLVTSKRKR